MNSARGVVVNAAPTTVHCDIIVKHTKMAPFDVALAVTVSNDNFCLCIYLTAVIFKNWRDVKS